MADKVLVRPEEQPQRPKLEPSSDAGWRVVALSGVLLGLIGWLDILLMWVPPHFGRPEWEFGTVSATFDALPLATLGLALALAGVLAGGMRLRAQVLAWFTAAVLVILLAAVVLFLLNTPLAWKGIPPQNLGMLKKAIAKTLVLAVAYLVTYGLFGWLALKRLRAVGTPLGGQGA